MSFNETFTNIHKNILSLSIENKNNPWYSSSLKLYIYIYINVVCPTSLAGHVTMRDLTG